MTPYEILRIPEQASPEEIRVAYEELMERYSADRYLYGGMADLAENKRKEIQAAYEALTGQNGTSWNVSPSAAPTEGPPQGPAPLLPQEDLFVPAPDSHVQSAGSDMPWLADFDPGPAAEKPPTDAADRRKAYAEVSAMLREKRYFMARQRFDEIPPEENDAEWYHLAGLLAFHEGWLDNARQRLSKAVDLDPTNPEYQKDRKKLDQKRSVKRANAASGTGGCPGCSSLDGEEACQICFCECCCEAGCETCCEIFGNM